MQSPYRYMVYNFAGQTPTQPQMPAASLNSENEKEWARKTLSYSIVDYIACYVGPYTDESLKSFACLDSSQKHNELYKIAIEELVKQCHLMRNKDNTAWIKWPNNICKKCKTEIKERELYLSKFTGCMC